MAMLALVVVPQPAHAQTRVDDQTLLERFAPVVAVRRQAQKCGDGERFRPVTVDVIFDRTDVVLRDAGDNIVKRAPTASDLADLGEDYWIDLPGNALKPGCHYEKWFRRLAASPSIYGRVTKEQDRLVLQYWFYWVYNQWNDVHESDWEMIQLLFDTHDVDKAMTARPALYAYAQHEGVEYAERGEDKVQIVDGTHPVVYASEGSHASYFSATRWFGKSGATGFGCDDTSGPIDRIRPAVVPLPREAPRSGEFAWLSYEGHWGERQALFNNGPTGPAVKDKWQAPVTWVDENGRGSAVKLPFAHSAATDAFCSLSAAGSSLLNEVLADPITMIVLLAALLVAAVVIVRLASRGLLTRGARTWWRHKRTMLVIGGIVVAGGVLAWVAQFAILELTPLGTLVDVVGTSTPWVLPFVALTAAIVVLPVIAWVIAATMVVEADDARASSALGQVGRSHAVIVSAMLLAALLGLSLFVIPPLVILASFWFVAPVVSSREQLGVRGAIRRSSRLLRGYRWRALALVVTSCVFLGLAGLVGALVLLVTSIGFTGATIAVAIANGFVIPYVTLVGVHFYEEVTGEALTPHRRFFSRGSARPAEVSTGVPS
jgi:hypothetical protein